MRRARILGSLKFGGINPPAYKAASLRSRIMPTPMPAELVLGLQQHQGARSLPSVETGQRVLKYQRIASAADQSSLNLHAPTSGKITAIDRSIDCFGEGQHQQAIVLEPDGKDECEPIEKPGDFNSLSREEIIERIEAAGICGMGGAGFPSARKLRTALHSDTEFLLINAAECEPYISCDEALLRERAEMVISGAEVLRAACGARETMIVIESDKQAAIDAVREAIQDSEVALKLVRPRYPAGEERQLFRSVTGIELPRANRPPDARGLVFNAATAAAAHTAVIEGKPCISRIVTLTGAPLQTPKNFDVPIGTAISHLLNLCGADSHSYLDTIIGGSLMGNYLPDTESPVSKTTNCIIATSASEFSDPGPELACIRCGYCATVCPTHLLPQTLLQFAIAGDLESAEEYGLADCIECGACAHVCPSNIPLVQHYRATKAAIVCETVNRQTSKHRQQRFQLWQYRQKKLVEHKKETRKTRPEPGKEQTSLSDPDTGESFSRERARDEIAAAVARVKQKRTGKAD